MSINEEFIAFIDLIPNNDKRKNLSRGSFKGGKITINGYWWIHHPSHPHSNCRGYVQENRLVMEKHLGRYLSKEEKIHHKNKNRIDNRIENLQLVTNSEHMTLHLRKYFITIDMIKIVLEENGRMPITKLSKEIIRKYNLRCGLTTMYAIISPMIYDNTSFVVEEEKYKCNCNIKYICLSEN